MAVELITIAEEDADQRLDRWFKRRYPGVTQGRLQKMLRTGQVRVDGKRIKEAGFRLQTGHEVRVPPMSEGDQNRPRKSDNPANKVAVDPAELEALRARVLYKDDHVLVIDKPAGLAVQGGSGTTHHLDGMLDGLQFDAAERPRLVHRLDKDTSGVLVLARTRKAATALARSFQTKEVRKQYWAVVVGTPEPEQGKVDLPLSKRPAQGGEKVWIDEFSGKRAVTHYRVIEKAARKAAWVELEPVTGRTHQLRVHMVAMHTPILGDGKYGGSEAFLTGAVNAKRLHLHARAIRFQSPAGGMVTVSASLPDHMAETWNFLGFIEADAEPPFTEPLP
ncbi:MAG: RluA family pseudouridine synthase [Rhodospirillaceae bacterium]|nr:RluA family pseudouridine synthase [Rhodospirillaceae bacterium]